MTLQVNGKKFAKIWQLIILARSVFLCCVLNGNLFVEIDFNHEMRDGRGEKLGPMKIGAALHLK